MNMIRKLKLKGKLSALMLLIGVIPLIIAVFGINWAVRDHVKANVTEQFDAMAAVKQEQIEDYFSRIQNQMLTLAEDKMIVEAMRDFTHAYRALPAESGMQKPETAAEYRRKVEAYYASTFKSAYSEKNNNSAIDASVLLPDSDAAIAAQYLYIANNKYPLGEKNKLMDANDSSSYTSVHKKYHPIINNFLEKFGYYDIFLIDADSGSVVYSVFKEADFASNVLSGYLQNTNLSKLAQQAKSLPAGSTKLVDFAEYFPSYNLPAAFSVAPIYDGNQLIGILASQLPMGKINSMMQSSLGMGESGETYLAGSDLLMRSQSRFSKENTVFKTKVATPAVKAALEGKSGAMLNQDYRGIDVISAYRPLKIEGLNWVLIAKIDQAEAFDLLASITNISSIGLVLVAVIILLVGRTISGRVATPIIAAAQVADNIAAGKLDNQINTEGHDEISQLMNSLDAMQADLKQQIEDNRKVTAEIQAQQDAIGKSMATIEFNMDGTIIGANELFLKAMGYSLSEIQGRHHSMFADPGVANSVEYRQFWEKLNRGEFDAGEYKRLGKNGKEIWLQATYNPIPDLNGKPVKVIKYAADVTETKLKNADFSGQIEAIDKSQAVIQFNMDGTIITANELFCKLMGYSLAEIQGRHHSMFAEPGTGDTVEYRQFWEKLNRGEFDRGEYKRLGKGGRTVYLQASYNPIFDLNGKPFKVVKYASDITAQTLTNQTLAQIFSEVGTVMGNVAEGDLTLKITGDYEGIYLQCKNAINESIDKLSEIVGNVSSSAVFINNSSKEIASGNNNLSQRAEQQAANLEETAASMEELTSTVKNNADNAQQANMVASNAGELAEKGGNVVRAAISAMQEINESSNKIADIIGVIDEIAFQTNLLALNASVEAARAGEQGRGFSVVATEVRNLAQRSATAARESKDLIQNSVQKVRAGTEFVNETGKALSEIVTSVKKVGEIVAGIANASVEQSAGIAQVNQAVSQMDEITQQNAALAEQASAASVSMSDLSSNMVEMLAFFRLNQNSSSHRSSHNHNHAAPKGEESSKSAPSLRPTKATTTHNKQVSYDSTSDDEWQDF